MIYAQPPANIQRHEQAMADTSDMVTLIRKGRSILFSDADSLIYFLNKALVLARSKKDMEAMAICYNFLGEGHRLLGNLPASLADQWKALELHEKNKDISGRIASYTFMGACYIDLQEYEKALEVLKLAEALQNEADQSNIPNTLVSPKFTLTNLGYAYEMMGAKESAFIYQRKAIDRTDTIFPHTPVISLAKVRLANLYLNSGDVATALRLYHEEMANAIDERKKLLIAIPMVYAGSAKIHHKLGNIDSALFYGRRAFSTSITFVRKPITLVSATLLKELFTTLDRPDSALYYSNYYQQVYEDLYGVDKLRELQQLVLSQQAALQEETLKTKAQQYRTRLIALGAALSLLFVVAYLLYRNAKNNARARQQIAEAYETLKATQAQLIQAEKLASLGQLTAGIAHELKNPLNFVNNFSELNQELIDEMQEAIDSGDTETARALANDIRENQQKIFSHGKRADEIIKGMLAHSRSSTGKLEKVDLNALVEEFARHAHHGMRASSPGFAAKYRIQADPNIPEMELMPQDIGRVLLNLLTNAFFAVQQKANSSPEAGYAPLVTITTRSSGKTALIEIADNGIGIPGDIREKIFQPFFTTKPTGQGTGLGLSLSYDIVKAHGGELKVESEENKGSTFIVEIPADH
ncbi:MAG TPA: ATP-binding protein [Phnomibacter sp.]|nr:ATP-binding protein [Phnomibacter sp.]